MMKKFIALVFGTVLVISFAGCSSSSSDQNTNGPSSAYTSSVEVLNKVYETYTDEEKFPVGGGDSEHMTTDAPGAFDISKTEELTSTLSLPESEIDHVDDAASMIHMMNANTFTGAAYHLTSDISVNDFAEAMKESILSKQWSCGMPDTLIVIDVDGQYVITAYGAEDLVEIFKTNALSVLDGSEVIVETPVVEN